MTTAWSRYENGSALPFPGARAADLSRVDSLEEGNGHPGVDHRCASCGQPVGYWAVDRMTGVFDRWGWDDAALRVLRRAERACEPVALLMLDLDYFKAVNDRFGHLAGDTMLRSVATVMRAATGEEDVVGRYGGRGGDEFLALLSTADRERALAVAGRIRESVRSAKVTVPDAASGVSATLAGQTVSIGVALYAPTGGTAAQLDDLLLDADAALLMAKREGRDRVRLLSRPHR
jgi:diguanylate cyclase (GGDEF)-like protein